MEMKSIVNCVLILGLLAISLADDTLEKACIAESKANLKDVGDFWEPTVNYDKTTPSVKCFLRCIMEKLGQFEGGVFNIDKAQKAWNDFSEKDGSPVVNQKAFPACKDKKGENDCETGFEIVKCLRTFKA